MGGKLLGQALGCAGQIQLDHLAGARAHQKQLPNIGAALQQRGHFAVKLGIGIGHAGQIFFFQNRGAKAGFGKNHHARCRLQQMGAGARPDHQEKRILHLAMQPDDRGEAAENLVLAALFDHRGIQASAGHIATPRLGMAGAGWASRAWRSFHRNCTAFTA